MRGKTELNHGPDLWLVVWALVGLVSLFGNIALFALSLKIYMQMVRECRRKLGGE